MTLVKRIALLVAAVMLVSACASSPAPTPQIVFVTPEPTAAPTPTPTAEPTPVPTAEPTDEPVDEEPGAPVVAFKTWGNVGEDWKARFTKVDWNAWPEVKKANQFNDKPPKGYTLVMPWLEYEYLGSERESFNPGFTFRAYGASGVEYSQFEDPTCGVLPEPDVFMDDPTLRKGGKAKGWICFAVKDEDLDSLVLFTQLMSDFTDETLTIFELR